MTKLNQVKQSKLEDNGFACTWFGNHYNSHPTATTIEIYIFIYLYKHRTQN